jgi:DNA-binding NarL/FixJ family response regulator
LVNSNPFGRSSSRAARPPDGGGRRCSSTEDAQPEFRAGAQAYLLKSASAAIVTDGVERVLDGGVYADPTVAPLLATGTRVRGTDNTRRELSAREVEVLQLVADGQSNKEIGDALSLSPLSVKSSLSRIGRKLGAGDRAQMVALAMRAGVIR